MSDQLDQNQTKLHYDGNFLTVIMLYLQLVVGSIITLGFYNFWGRNNLRRYMIGSIKIGQDRCQYHGTGEELFLCFLKFLGQAAVYIVANFMILKVGIYLLGWQSDLFLDVMLVLNAIFIQGALFYAVHRILKYRLSRISWRGIRYNLKGSSWSFVKLCFMKTILNIVSFSLLVPKSTLEIYGAIINNLYFGDQRYRFKFDSHGLLKPHLVSLLLFIPTLGISRVWYWVKLHGFMIDHLEFMDLKFENNSRFSSLLSLYLTNLVLIVCTLGLGIPFASHRAMKYHVENLVIIGDLNRKRIVQAKTYSVS